MIGKENIRGIKGRIRTILMEEWDPIGVSDIPEAADEYDSYLGGIYELIARGADTEEIGSYLRTIEVEQIELVIPDSQRIRAAASLLRLKPLCDQ